jgi:hypothetical protein
MVRKDPATYRKQEYLRARQAIIDAKSRPCMDCKGEYPWYVMDFDHVRGSKSFNIGASRRVGARKLAEEIGKCDVICSNCHRVRTFRRSSIPL